MTSAKAQLLADLHELTKQLEEDGSEGDCLPSGLLRSLESELSASRRFLQKRGQKGPQRPTFSHNTTARVSL